MPIVDESKQNKGVNNNNTRNKQIAIDMEYYNRLNHLRFKSPYLGAKYQQRVIPVRTLNGVQDVFVDNRGTIKQGGHTNSKLYNYSNKNRTHPILNAIVNGKSVNNRLNFLANNNRTDEYGSIAGGRIIIQAGKEIRLVSGSIDNIRDEIEAMKSRNNVKTVDLYTLDNGTYHSGLRTFDKIFTRDDLLKYDAQNTGGGNFLYIK